jgi:hypothetical protein
MVSRQMKTAKIGELSLQKAGNVLIYQRFPALILRCDTNLILFLPFRSYQGTSSKLSRLRRAPFKGCHGGAGNNFVVSAKYKRFS